MSRPASRTCLLCGLTHRTVTGQIQLARPFESGLGLQRIFGDVDQDRPWPSGAGDVECRRDSRGDIARLGDQVAVLGDRHGDAADIGFLESVGADRRAAYLSGDGDDRNGVHMGVRDGRDEIGCAGSGGRHADPDLSGRHGVAFGGVAGALLVSHQDVADLVGIEERVVGGKNRTTWNPEYDVCPHALERSDERLRSGQLICPVVLRHLGSPCP